MAQDLPNIRSIFDFLYVDTYRIKSYYAQLTGFGALSGLKQRVFYCTHPLSLW